jgi:ubiquinone/menaquinone biosynthesis C-methylase UbiE
MKRMDLLVPCYDFLAGRAFGGQIKKATTEYFDLIGEHDKVLIIGGGTGWVLEKFPQANLQVTYVDISKGMIRKARSRKVSFRVEFITGSYTAIPDAKYDVIIIPFFLDMLSNDKAGDVMQHVIRFLKNDGIWLFSDFIPSNKFHHRVLIRMMYWFFSLFYDIEKFRLPNYDYWFNKSNLRLIKKKDSGNGLFTSRVYLMEEIKNEE